MYWSGVDYCDVFISCLDSHSDGTHSLVSKWCISPNLFWWRKTHLHLGWPEVECIFIFGWTIPSILHCLEHHQRTFAILLIAKFLPQLSTLWKYGSQNDISTYGKRSNIQKMLENQRLCITWRTFIKHNGQFNCSEQTRDSWTSHL